MALIDTRVDQIAAINQQLQEEKKFEVAASLHTAKHQIQRELDQEFRRLQQMSAPWAYMPAQVQSAGCDQ